MSSRFSYLLEAFAVEWGCTVLVQGAISIHVDLRVMMCYCLVSIAGERKKETTFVMLIERRLQKRWPKFIGESESVSLWVKGAEQNRKEGEYSKEKVDTVKL